MKKRKTALLYLLLAIPVIITAQTKEISYKFGGFVEFKSYFDDYRSRTSRYDLQYKYPLAPDLNDNGIDINMNNSLNYSIAASRLTFSVAGMKFLNADVNTYVEADFLGAGESYLNMFNLRHLYMNFQWKKSSLLMGQTNHLSYVAEVASNMVGFGSGYPFNTLNRGMQIRFETKLAEKIKFLAAAEMYSGHKSLGPASAQAQAGIPDLHAQLKFGDASTLFGGVTVGYKFFKPRNTDGDKNSISTTISAFDISIFAKAVIGKGYSVKLWGIYGENLSMFNMLGGYGKIAYTGPDPLDFDYTNLRTLSAWAEFETPSYNNFNFGLFYGYQKNCGTNEKLDTSTYGLNYLYFSDQKLEWFSRVSPRITYSLSKKLIFGLEYNLTFAKWSKSVDANMKPLASFDVNHNNRLEFMAKLNF
ncbi:MAG: hypothetical protein VB022_07255 [Rikenellaceae bacterium]|nr:hypothetical protein [Rikenellaceae bacterium]